MRLDPDCMRDILLFVEGMDTYILDDDNDIILQGAFLEDMCQKLTEYSEEQIFYTLEKLEEGGFLNMSTQWGGDALVSCHISSLTYEGHEFLEGIRDSKRWNIVKAGLSTIRSYSLAAIAAIAEGVTSGSISTYLSNVKT